MYVREPKNKQSGSSFHSIVTMFKDDESLFAAMRAGARGYVLKGADQDEMLRAIRAVAKGEALLLPLD